MSMLHLTLNANFRVAVVLVVFFLNKKIKV